MTESREHDLFAFTQEVTDEMAAEYKRISDRTAEDPGTAGDAGEENWADLMRQWLPPAFPVETKGRIVSHEGSTSPQLDVLVLHPSYPQKLRKKKLYMSTGVLAAFECKLTLRRPHIRQAFATATKIHNLLPQRQGNPHDELHHSVIYGLLAHSHDWRAAKSSPEQNIEGALDEAHQQTARPCDVPEFLCVADLATWTTLKLSSTSLLLQTPGAQAMPLEQRQAAGAMPMTQYMRPTDLPGSPKSSPVGAMLAKLLMRLGFENDVALPVSDYFRLTGLLGSAEAFSNREWPATAYSEIVRNQLPARLVNDGSNKWGMAFV